MVTERERRGHPLGLYTVRCLLIDSDCFDDPRRLANRCTPAAEHFRKGGQQTAENRCGLGGSVDH